jgi:hypothetical protein
LRVESGETVRRKRAGSNVEAALVAALGNTVVMQNPDIVGAT